MKLITRYTRLGHRESKNYIGTHVLADFWDCSYPDDAVNLLEILTGAATAANAEVVGSSTHEFKPSGTTVLVLLAESHISIHTWPEYSYVAVDVFTCGHNMKPEIAIAYLEKELHPQRKQVKVIKRGKE